jgi:hypothetical protein
MKKLLFTSLFLLSLAFAGFSQTIPPPYINYQAVLYDLNGANPNSPLTNQSFSTFVNINDELGNLLYREEHYASTDANGLITVKMGDGLYTAGPITNFNQINWGVGKYYLVVDFNINGTISSTAPEQLVTVPYSFYAGNAGNGMTAVADNGNGTLTFTYANGQTYITPALTGMTGPAGPAGAQGIQGIPGANGAVGATGQNGLNALIKTTSEAAGANCTNGGTKIETGLDANGNGVLDAGEVNASQTKYVCDGINATSSLGGIGFNHFFPDGFQNVIKVAHTIVPTYSSGISPTATPYTVPIGKNLYITNVLYSSRWGCSSTGFRANNVLLYGGVFGCQSTNSTNPFIIGESMILNADMGNGGGCSNSCGGYASFQGILVDKNVTVILQTSAYVVPIGQLFIMVGTSTYPTVYTSGQTVPANTNGYLIPN